MDIIRLTVPCNFFRRTAQTAVRFEIIHLISNRYHAELLSSIIIEIECIISRAGPSARDLSVRLCKINIAIPREPRILQQRAGRCIQPISLAPCYKPALYLLPLCIVIIGISSGRYPLVGTDFTIALDIIRLTVPCNFFRRTAQTAVRFEIIHLISNRYHAELLSSIIIEIECIISRAGPSARDLSVRLCKINIAIPREPRILQQRAGRCIQPISLAPCYKPALYLLPLCIVIIGISSGRYPLVGTDFTIALDIIRLTVPCNFFRRTAQTAVRFEIIHLISNRYHAELLSSIIIEIECIISRAGPSARDLSVRLCKINIAIPREPRILQQRAGRCIQPISLAPCY